MVTASRKILGAAADGRRARHEMTDHPSNQGQWEPPKGPVAKAIAWLILIVFGLILLGMLIIVFWGR